MVISMDDGKGNKQENQEEGSQFRFLEFVSYFIFAVGPLVANAVLVLLGDISSDFMINPTTLLIVIPAFMFPFAFLQLFSGAISDVYGRVPVIVGGLVAFAASLFLSVISTSIEIFALANFVSGVGFGFVNPVILSLLSDCAIPKDIPKRMGVASALASLSVGLGPFIAGQMAVLGWQIYYLLFLILVIFSIFAFLVAKRPPRKVHSGSGVGLFLANLSLELRKPVVLLMLITTFLVALAQLGTLVWTSRGLAGVLDETLIGLLLLGNGIFGAIAGYLLGLMIPKFGYRLPVWMGLLTLFSGLFVFIFVGDITLAGSVPFVLLGLAVVGWAGGLLFPTMITISQVISPKRRGVLAGVVTFSFFLGSAINPTLYEPLFILGMNWVYVGILGVSLILLLFFGILLQKMKSGI
jgi:MFS family permease